MSFVAKKKLELEAGRVDSLCNSITILDQLLVDMVTDPNLRLLLIEYLCSLQRLGVVSGCGGWSPTNNVSI